VKRTTFLSYSSLARAFLSLHPGLHLHHLAWAQLLSRKQWILLFVFELWVQSFIFRRLQFFFFCDSKDMKDRAKVKSVVTRLLMREIPYMIQREDQPIKY